MRTQSAVARILSDAPDATPYRNLLPSLVQALLICPATTHHVHDILRGLVRVTGFSKHSMPDFDERDLYGVIKVVSTRLQFSEYTTLSRAGPQSYRPISIITREK